MPRSARINLFSAVLFLLFACLSVSLRQPGSFNFIDKTTRHQQRLPLKSSFIYVSRNDEYNNFPSSLRLKSSLRALDRGLVQFGLERSSEIIVVDWASSPPLSEIPELSAGTSICIRWMLISPELLESKNMSAATLSEVHAYNAAARRAKGDLLLRLDQDTILTPDFFDWFARFHSYDEDTYIMFGRRDSDLGERDKILDDAWTYVSNKSIVSSTPRWNNNQFSITGFKRGSGAVGVIIFARNLWLRIQGYNEAMTGWGHMEVELFKRAFQATNRTAALPPEVKEWYPALHIYHERTADKPINPMGLQNSERRYNSAFGFAFEKLEEIGQGCETATYIADT